MSKGGNRRREFPAAGRGEWGSRIRQQTGEWCNGRAAVSNAGSRIVAGLPAIYVDNATGAAVTAGLVAGDNIEEAKVMAGNWLKGAIPSRRPDVPGSQYNSQTGQWTRPTWGRVVNGVGPMISERCCSGPARCGARARTTSTNHNGNPGGVTQGNLQHERGVRACLT